MKTKYNKNVKWLKPFVEAASKYINVKKITKVKGFRIPFSLQELTYATVTINRKNEISINVRIFNQLKVKGKNKHKPASIAQILEHLAHELAHLGEWEHSPAHFELTARIQLEFAKVLRKLKIEDTYTTKWSKLNNEQAFKRINS